ncbi:MAG: hypothetical protein H6Q00_3136 [Holophagaceae bacterium]|nr:hypothetical protein [Holophagaceae bacterium]
MPNDSRQKGGLTGPTRDGILEELCERKATLLLATPYLSFESRFLERDGAKLRIRAAMGRETVANTLAKHPLRLRFPWDLTMYSGNTRILDYEQDEHRRTLVVSVPESLGVDELRRAYREERVGKSMGALASSTLSSVSIQPFSLENLSIHGAGIFLKDYRHNDAWLPGITAQISIELDNGPCISTTARICHSSGPYLGVEFQPPLEDPILGLTHRWIETRRAEAQRRWEDRAQIRAQAREAAQPKAPPAGILLLSSDQLLGSQLEASLAGAHALRVVPAVMAPYKAALAQPPLLLLVDTAGMGGDERRRAKALLEAQPPACPILVLGREAESEHPRTLALELKHASYLEWNPSKGASLRILTQGLIRKHWKAE